MKDVNLTYPKPNHVEKLKHRQRIEINQIINAPRLNQVFHMHFEKQTNQNDCQYQFKLSSIDKPENEYVKQLENNLWMKIYNQHLNEFINWHLPLNSLNKSNAGLTIRIPNSKIDLYTDKKIAIIVIKFANYLRKEKEQVLGTMPSHNPIIEYKQAYLTGNQPIFGTIEITLDTTYYDYRNQRNLPLRFFKTHIADGFRFQFSLKNWIKYGKNSSEDLAKTLFKNIIQNDSELNNWAFDESKETPTIYKIINIHEDSNVTDAKIANAIKNNFQTFQKQYQEKEMRPQDNVK